MSVQVKSGQLRATPSYLGTLVAPLNYGDRLQVLTGVSLKKQFPTSFQFFLVQKIDQIALRNGGSLKTIRAIEPYI